MTCRHWWVIKKVKSGPETPGSCKRCGAERMFPVELRDPAHRLWNTRKKRAVA